jgi:3,4-dihydroxy 2-butanone 4-phosphate synthase/GTP cyclohydrolase II
MQTERLVRRVAERQMRLDQTGTMWSAAVYEIVGESRQYLALVKGPLDGSKPVLCRVHTGSLLADLFSSTLFEGGSNLREAITTIEAAGAGVVLYISPNVDIGRELGGKPALTGEPVVSRPATLREFGLGAQVLSDLGCHKLRLLTNSQTKIAGLNGFGLEVVERVPLISMQGEA